MEYYALSDTGRLREQNQDFYCVSEEGRYPVYVLCDGMGGHRAGEVASEKAAKDITETMVDLMNEDDGSLFVKIASSVSHANNLVYSMSLKEPLYSGMGTTCEICAISPDGAHIGHIGDSRVYIFAEKGLYQVTKDHSLVEEMIDQGRLTREEAATYEQRSYITRALGTQPTVQADTYLVAFRPGDIILMCSDGLTNMVAEIDIAYVLSEKTSLEEKAKRLVDMANDNGGQDNITVILIKR